MRNDLSGKGTKSAGALQQNKIMHILAKKLAQWLLETGAIDENEKELYEYAVFSFLFSLFPLCLVMIIGGISGMFIEGFLMILPFMMIRKFSGGYHLKFPGICLASSTLLLSALLFTIRFVINRQQINIFTCFVIASVIQIFLCSPIYNDIRKLNEKERLTFQKIARIMSALFLAVYFLFWGLGQLRLCVPVGSGILLTALLQVPCLFTKNHPLD